jgi:hypothetical protein
MGAKEERLILKGLATEKEEKLIELNIKGDRLVKDLNVYTFSMVAEGTIEGIQIDHARQAMKELVQTYDEYMRTKEDIARLRREL